MKKKQPQKLSPESESPAKKTVVRMTLLLRISFVLCVVATLCLFAGITDLKVVNLTGLLSKYTAAFLGFQLFSSLICGFAVSLISSAEKDIIQQQLGGINVKIDGRIGTVEGKVEEYLGENYKKLTEQNESMKSEFDTIREEANNKIIAEIEELRIENADLRKKLNDKTDIREETLEQENQLQVA